MSNFEKDIISLGEVHEMTTIKAEFKVISDKNVVKVKPSCGCTPSKFTKKLVTITYRTGNIPFHLQSIGKSEIAKYADIYFDDNSVERVSMVATLIK